jgi:X-Pro dipeptidyl-peptidase C-terminal non-catalytic domain
MADFLWSKQIDRKKLKPFLLEQAERIKKHAGVMASGAGRPYQEFSCYGKMCRSSRRRNAQCGHMRSSRTNAPFCARQCRSAGSYLNSLEASAESGPSEFKPPSARRYQRSSTARSSGQLSSSRHSLRPITKIRTSFSGSTTVRVPEGADSRGELEVDLWSTSNVFLAGHRLRVQVTSSSFPRWDRNLNTGNQRGTRIEVARQRIHHGGADRTCWVELPVVGD